MTDPVFITGVSQRVGLSLAKTFLDRGVPVIGTYRTERTSIEVLRKTGAELYRCDFYQDDEVAALLQQVEAQHPKLRALIHNASEWLPDQGDLVPEEVLRRMMTIHVGIPYRLNLALQPALAACEHAWADIIHVGDYVSSRGSRKHIAYAASKAAQDNLTLSFAARFAPHIKVNSIAPSLVMFNDHDDDDYKQKTLQKSLLQREAGLEEFQRTVDYLLDSHFVTGRILYLDGGRHVL